jgi:general secretion pathway protein G
MFFKKTQRKSNISHEGFTLIELILVVAIIGLLTSIMLVSMQMVREKAKYTKAQMELNQIKKAMSLYKLDVGELPPRGDSCPICSWPDGAAGWDTRLMQALMNNDGTDWDGPYLSTEISKDPWGNYYTYDDNDCNSNCGNSYIRTVGPDGAPGGGDDYMVLVTSLQELSLCSIPCFYY